MSSVLESGPFIISAASRHSVPVSFVFDFFFLISSLLSNFGMEFTFAFGERDGVEANAERLMFMLLREMVR